MKTIKISSLFLLTFLIGGCATAPPPAPEEPEIAVKLEGSAIEVQHFIEERLRMNTTGEIAVDSADDRQIVFKADCENTPNMNGFKCGALLYGLAGGGTGWDGPFLLMTFRTTEIRGIVSLTMASKWCATNAFGKSNCQDSGTNAERNDILRKIENSYNKEFKAANK